MRKIGPVVLWACLAAAQQASQDQPVKFATTSNLVVLNVAVNGPDGKPAHGLSSGDFTVFEDNQRVKLTVFEYQSLSRDLLPPIPETSESPAPPLRVAPPVPAVTAEALKDRRLIVLFFDLSSMSPPEQKRAQDSACQFIDREMTSADMLAVAAYSSSLRLLQEFTNDRSRLVRAIRSLEAGSPDSVAEAGAGPVSAASGASVGDDAELGIFNTDQRFRALEDISRQLGKFPERKTVVYFSSGAGSNGIENQSQLRRTVNAAIRSNVVFYSIDARGLTADAPAGGAGSRSGGGQDLFSGNSASLSRTQFISQQDTLYSLASDTGGKAVLRSNDLATGIRQAQQDSESYYVLGYYTPNDTADGKFRKVRVELKSQPRAKLEYRPGYYAAKTFRMFDESEKESQLQEALALENPLADIPMAIEVNYFRLAKNQYFVPVAVKIPGSAITLLKKGNREEAAFDFIGTVRKSNGATVGTVRDTIRVKLASESAGQLSGRSLQYDAAFTLAPGEYTFKLLVRENVEGKMGTFLTRYVVPDVSAETSGIRMSSIVWSGQREKLESVVGTAGESRKRQQSSPLVKDGQKLVPSVTRVLKTSQNLYVYFEVYDSGADPSVAANLAFYRDKQLVYESQEVRLTQGLPDRQQAIPFQIQLPLEKLAPGRYTAQINVIDERGKKFSVSRSQLILTR